MHPRRIPRIIPRIRPRFALHPQRGIQQKTICARLEIRRAIRQIVAAEIIRWVDMYHVEWRFLFSDPGFRAVQRGNFRGYVSYSAVCKGGWDFGEAVVSVVGEVGGGGHCGEGQDGDDGGGDDYAAHCAGFAGGFEDAQGALDGGLDEVGIVVVALGEFGDDGRGDVDDVFGVFGCFVESAGSEEVRDDDEREVGEVWGGLKDVVRFEGCGFLLAADGGADVVACFESGA